MKASTPSNLSLTFFWEDIWIGEFSKYPICMRTSLFIDQRAFFTMYSKRDERRKAIERGHIALYIEPLTPRSRGLDTFLDRAIRLL